MIIENYNIIYKKEVTSTQDILKHEDHPHATAIVTDVQTNGRGRFNRTWISSKNDLLLSILLQDCEMEHISQISFIGALAIASSILDVKPLLKLELKWVNDVLIDRKKVSGILIEKLNNKIIVGMGLNIHKTDESLSSTSLEEVGISISRDDLLHIVLSNFKQYYNLWLEKGFAPISALWIRHCGYINETITYLNNNTGVFLGIDEIGNMIVMKDKKIEIINCGEVTFGSK